MQEAKFHARSSRDTLKRGGHTATGHFHTRLSGEHHARQLASGLQREAYPIIRLHMAEYHSSAIYCPRCFLVIHPPGGLYDHICTSNTGPIELPAPTKDPSSISLTTKDLDRFISDFATELYQNIPDGPLDPKSFWLVADALPDLLRHFAMSIGFNAPSQEHREVMFLVDKYHK